MSIAPLTINFLKHKPSKRDLDNQIYRKQILEIYTKANKKTWCEVYQGHSSKRLRHKNL
ncbi:Mobile element protein [Streptococcus agalactiae ILRI112]|nr:Mobile element protein [Streptococcus agalactiae ILRI112]